MSFKKQHVRRHSSSTNPPLPNFHVGNDGEIIQGENSEEGSEQTNNDNQTKVVRMRRRSKSNETPTESLPSLLISKENQPPSLHDFSSSSLSSLPAYTSSLNISASSPSSSSLSSNPLSSHSTSSLSPYSKFSTPFSSTNPTPSPSAIALPPSPTDSSSEGPFRKSKSEGRERTPTGAPPVSFSLKQKVRQRIASSEETYSSSPTNNLLQIDGRSPVLNGVGSPWASPTVLSPVSSPRQLGSENRPPSPRLIEEFEYLADKFIAGSKAELTHFKACDDEHCSKRCSACREKMLSYALSLYQYYDQQEMKLAKLSPHHFHIKALVDDVLFQLLGSEGKT